MITYVPDSKGRNKSECEALASALGLEMFEFVTPQPGSGSMTAAKTHEVRERTIKDKFVFDLPKIPYERNVVIYDDAAKSCMTLDVICQVLGNRKIVALVKTIWNCQGLPPPMTLTSAAESTAPPMILTSVAVTSVQTVEPAALVKANAAHAPTREVSTTSKPNWTD